jgi:predicted acylesterase/phospholipase RssA
MGEVVELEKTPKAKSGPRPATSRKPAGGGSRRREKTALVLGGGGFTGGVYQIGALRALDLLTVNRTVNDFDIYIGTSAGAFVSTLVANGITPEEMSRVVNNQAPTPFREVDLGTLLRLNYSDFLSRGLLLPLRLAGLMRTLAGRWREVSVMDVLTGLAEGLPPGIYTGAGVEKYMREILTDSDMTDDFRLVEPELYLTATDLDTCERVVFGATGWDDVPISKAVSASAALPMVYRPVEIKGRQFIDGGIRSTTNVDLAVERGAKFIVVVNPLVPYVNDFQKRIPTIFGSRVRRVSDMGYAQVGYQAFKLLAHARLHEHVKRWSERYPGVDIILIEPDPNDELMFGTSIMNYSSRIQIARHGFESVTLKLAQDYHRYKRICEKHGIQISARRVTKILRQAEEQREKVAAWRRILEQTTGALLRQSDERG